MRKLTNAEIANLSHSDWENIGRSLRKQFRHFDNSNINNISFGAKQKNEQRKKSKLPYVRFLVNNKRNPRSKKDRIEETVEVRLWRPDLNEFVLVVLPTDVEEIGSIELTGRTIFHQPTNVVAGTAGLVVRTRRPTSNGGFSYLRGVISVGHPYVGLQVPINVRCDSRSNSGQSVDCEILERAPQNSLFDAAFLESTYTKLEKQGYLDPNPIMTSVPTESELSTIGAEKKSGYILRPAPNNQMKIKIIDYITKTMNPLPGLGVNMKSLLRASGEIGAFFVGTSGSVWRVGKQAVSIQFAVDPATNIGYSQSTTVLMHDWLKKKVEADEVKFITAF